MLFVVSGVLAERGVGAKPDQAKAAKPTRPRRKKQLPPARRRAEAPVVDDGVDAEIEAILRKRGIT